MPLSKGLLGKIAQFYVYNDYITVCSYNDFAIYKIENDSLNLVS